MFPLYLGMVNYMIIPTKECSTVVKEALLFNYSSLNVNDHLSIIGQLLVRLRMNDRLSIDKCG